MRVSSDPARGAGHLSRSGALAMALARAGVSVQVILDKGGAAWPSTCTHEDVHVGEDTGKFQRDWNGAILDSYALDPGTIRTIANVARPLAVMDDFLSPPPEADILINAALHLCGDRVGDVPALLGPQYACIDPRFAKPVARPVPETVEHILVTFGAIDPDNITGRVLSALHLLSGRGFNPDVTFVASSRFPHLAHVRRDVERLNGRGRLMVDVADMVSLMADADLIVGSGGVSLTERLAMGVPSITVQIAENQRLSIEGAVNKGATIACSTDVSEMADTIANVSRDQEARQSMVMAGRDLVDGQGAERVARRLMDFAANRELDHAAH